MDWDTIKFALSLVLLFLIMLALLAGCVGGVHYSICADRTANDITNNYRWHLFAGCLVQLPNGMWIAVENIHYGAVDGKLLIEAE